MYENGKIYMGLAGDKRVELALNMCNRHGLIAGASGTGKTITMKVMAESFSDAGVPVFLCDVKGDVAGICAPGQSSEGMEKRIDKFGLRERFAYRGYPTTFWDIYQEGGHAVRATVSDMGPELLSRILGLTAVQEGILHIVFRIADDKGLLLIDLKDLRAMLTAANCGVALLATIHAADREELARKPLFAKLLEMQVFRRLVTITVEHGRRVYRTESL